MAQLGRPPATRLPMTVRKLVAVDIGFHGYGFVLAEFGFTVALSAAGALWIAYYALTQRGAVSPILSLLGAYFLSLALNYVVLLVYGLALARRRSARDEVAAELSEKAVYAPRYGAQQFLLLLPLVIPALALAQEIRRRT